MELSMIKRAIMVTGDEIPQYKLPEWTWIVLLLNFVVFLPVFVLIDYTLKTVYPVFAMVEDENPPAYEPVSLREALDDDIIRPGSKHSDLDTRTVTSSLRAINRLLKANGGVMANFRGFTCALAQALMTSFLMGLFTMVLGGMFTPVATLLSSLALVQVSAGWVHIVIARPSPLPFWRRLPAFKRTFDATWRAVTLHWLAFEVARWVPFVVAELVGLTVPDLQAAAYGPSKGEVHGVFFAKMAAVFLVTLLGSIVFVVPAKVILVRVQASLLPPDEDTIIPFDRSFEGRVEPAVVDGRGFATMSDAWSTFSKAAWRRLLVLYVKIFGVSVAAVTILGLFLVPEIFLIVSNSTRVD
ncbi:hypothetical protein HIM_00588 [Hirsutella minnesotensis 3608]|nr:hypothetical protein HIM_00588 [Hirsutella minnesotensis 3608]